MRFTKMHGAGNDFIVLNNIDGILDPASFPQLAVALCTRRLSIGADGLMIVDRPKKDGDFYMHFYNSDGTEGEMCGNGARCICRYGYENGLAGETIRVETKSGTVIGRRKDKNLYTVRLNDPSVMILNSPVTIDGKTYDCSYMELGNPGLPHAVVHIPGLIPAENAALRELGRKIRFYKDFPKGANVNFYDICKDGSVNELTFERGVEDFTLACGTGTGCTASVLSMKGLISPENACLHMMGGTLYITVQIDNSVSCNTEKNIASHVTDICLTGPAVIVAEGEIKEVFPCI